MWTELESLYLRLDATSQRHEDNASNRCEDSTASAFIIYHCQPDVQFIFHTTHLNSFTTSYASNNSYNDMFKIGAYCIIKNIRKFGDSKTFFFLTREKFF